MVQDHEGDIHQGVSPYQSSDWLEFEDSLQKVGQSSRCNQSRDHWLECAGSMAAQRFQSRRGGISEKNSTVGLA